MPLIKGAKAKTRRGFGTNVKREMDWICDRCNRVLGSVKDDVKLLQAMINYLENDRGKVNSKEEKRIT